MTRIGEAAWNERRRVLIDREADSMGWMSSTKDVVVAPRFHESVQAAGDFELRVNGETVFVHDCEAGAFAGFAFSGRVEVQIRRATRFLAVKIRPLSRGVIADRSDEQTMRFVLDRPAKLSIEFDDDIRRPLFLFAEAPEQTPPQENGADVLHFAAGAIHEAGAIHLKDGQRVHIEAGAIVRGAIYADGVSDIRISGRGILDGRGFAKHEHRMIQPIRSRNILIEGITIVGSPGWTVCPYGCDDVVIRNVKIVNWRDNDDGIDIVGCQRVRIEDCFVRTKDDCIAIKAVHYHHSDAGLRDVKDVLIVDSVFWNAQWGNALEIGFETRCDSISDVTFRNCDVIRCEREGYYSGGVFSIHNGDRAIISNIRYEDIRVEDAREKLIDFKVQHSHYSKDDQRGQIRGVLLKDIHIVDGALPPSIIQSFDREHRVEDVTIENLRYRGEVIRTPLEAHAIIERAVNVRFV